MLFSELLTVAPRYARSINLERDGLGAQGVEGYIITSTAEDFLLRFGRSVVGYDHNRAWTLTGPYGAGKSSFAVFLANLFSPAQADGGKTARRLLREQHPDTYTELFDRGGKEKLGRGGFASIVVSGASESLLAALVRAANRDLSSHFSLGRKPDALRELEFLHDQLTNGRREKVSTTQVVGCIAKLAAGLVTSGRSRGILIIVDELGKFLEYAARHQDSAEIFVLQQLAEATANEKNGTLFLITILHQAFERYAAELRPSVRDEWAKIQGRFQDVGFQEPPEQLLELLARAIVVKHPNHVSMRTMAQNSRKLAERALSLDLAPKGMSNKGFLRAIERCAPLHPLTALALIRLCRKFGQNQRSLFSFLTSQEPHGFSSFLRETVESNLTFSLPELYDYLAEGLGSGLAVGESAAKWAEIQTALDRADSASLLEVRFIKSVGLLAAIGQAGNLKATADVVAFALGLDQQQFRRCRLALSQRSLIIDRRHTGTIALWEGSDIDLDESVRHASSQIAVHTSLAQTLNGLWAPRPLVAKRHSFQTGTLRYFTVRFADIANIGRLHDIDAGADGQIIYCLPANEVEVEMLRELATHASLREKRELLVAIPSDVTALREAVRELELLRHVQANTRELQGDAVARRELRSRVAAAENRVSIEVGRLFSPEDSSAGRTVWFHHGHEQEIPNSRTLADFLSGICNAVYSETPVLRNEIINRRNLSSAAAAARRNLIEKMIVNQSEARLGFVGTPPEISIYFSVLENPGIHRQIGAAWAFGSPTRDSGLQRVWNEIVLFFAECERDRRMVSDLFARLQRPPYGLKLGVIPILFCAAVIAHDTEIALYENGSFLPELSADAFERLVKSPERFELRRYRIEGVRRDVYIELARLFGRSLSERGENLLALMKPLFRFLHRLPKYCQQTQRLSENTIQVRSALMHAKEPDTLLFSDLPVACGLKPFTPEESDGEVVHRFFSAFRSSINELQRAYDDLLRDLQELLYRAFDQDSRSKLSMRAQSIAPYCVEPRLKAFVTHLRNSDIEDTPWIEIIATTITEKAPKSWSDEDRVRFEIALAESSRRIKHLEALVYEEQTRTASGKCLDDVFRIGISDRHTMEIGAVVAVDRTERRKFMEAVVDIQSKISDLGLRKELALAAIASVSKQLLSEYISEGEMERKDQEVLDAK